MPSELDLFVQDHATQLLKDRGFRKSGLIFRRASPDGDYTVVQFLRYPLGLMGSFHLSVAYVAASVKAINEVSWDGVAHPGKAPNMRQMGYVGMRTIAPPRGVTWQYDDAAGRGRCGRQMTTRLLAALDALDTLADRDVLFDVEFADIGAAIPNTRAFPDGGLDRFALLAERGPSGRLDQLLRDNPKLPAPVRDWVQARAAMPRAAREPAEYDAPALALRTALAGEVDPLLAELGFGWKDGGYVRTSDRGDEATVVVTLSMTTAADVVVVYVKGGVRPNLAVRFDASRSTPSSPRRMLWQERVVPPTRAHRLARPDVSALGLRPWRLSIGDLAPAPLAAAIRAEALRVTDLLDRDVLHALIDEVETPKRFGPHRAPLARAMLVADDPAHPRHADAMRAVQYETEAALFLPWLWSQPGQKG